MLCNPSTNDFCPYGRRKENAMNENIDLTKILEGCPVWTEFYHAGYGRVWFVGIYPDRPYPINFRLGYTICNGAVTSAGTINKNYDGERAVCSVF